jgi:hypothetical protein
MIDYILAMVFFLVALTVIIVVEEWRYRRRMKDILTLLRKDDSK